MATEAFTAADGTALTTHDANWGSIGNGAGGSLGATGQINSNAVGQTTSGGGFVATGARHTTSSSHSVQMVCKGGSYGALHKKIHVHSSATSQGYYAAFTDRTADTFATLAIYKEGNNFLSGVSGSWSRLSDHTIRLDAIPNGGDIDLELFIGGVSVDTHTDSTSPITSGNPGWSVSSSAAQPDSLFDDYNDLVSSGYSLTCDDGSFALTGQDITLTKDGRKVLAETGLYTLLGSSAYVDLSLALAAGSFTLTGQDIVTRTLRRLVAAMGSYSLYGTELTLNWSGAPPESGFGIGHGRRRRRR